MSDAHKCAGTPPLILNTLNKEATTSQTVDKRLKKCKGSRVDQLDDFQAWGVKKAANTDKGAALSTGRALQAIVGDVGSKIVATSERDLLRGHEENM